MKSETLKIGDRVKINCWTVNQGITTSGVITAVDNPGREYGVKYGPNKFATVFNYEVKKVC